MAIMTALNPEQSNCTVTWVVVASADNAGGERCESRATTTTTCGDDGNEGAEDTSKAIAGSAETKEKAVRATHMREEIDLTIRLATLETQLRIADAMEQSVDLQARAPRLQVEGDALNVQCALGLRPDPWDHWVPWNEATQEAKLSIRKIQESKPGGGSQVHYNRLQRMLAARASGETSSAGDKPDCACLCDSCVAVVTDADVSMACSASQSSVKRGSSSLARPRGCAAREL